MLGAPTSRRNDVGLHCYQSFYYNVFDPVHHDLVVHADFFEILSKLRQVPLAGIFVRTLIIFGEVWASILHVLFVFLVYRVVGQMDVLFVSCRLISRIFFRRKAGQTFFEQVDFERVETSYKRVDPKVEFESIY